MRALRQVASITLISLSSLASCTAQSLGDAARQQAQKKSSPPKTKHVITNEDLGSSVKSQDSPSKASTKKGGSSSSSDQDSAVDADRPSAQEIQAGIKDQKQKILAIEADMKDIQKQMEPWKTTDCTHVLHANTSMNTCDVPQKLTADYEADKAQLEQEKKNLADMQEDARKLGYANSVYDPN